MKPTITITAHNCFTICDLTLEEAMFLKEIIDRRRAEQEKKPKRRKR